MRRTVPLLLAAVAVMGIVGFGHSAWSDAVAVAAGEPPEQDPLPLPPCNPSQDGETTWIDEHEPGWQYQAVCKLTPGGFRWVPTGNRRYIPPGCGPVDIIARLF